MNASFRLPLYASHKETSPAKHISLTALLTMAMNPTTRPKDKADCLTPYDAEGKAKRHAVGSSYWALVCDHDDDNRDSEEISAIYDSYGCAWLAFTTSSHQQDKKGVTANRWKVVIPLLASVDSTRYGAICNGLAMLWNADKAQARVQQVFYAPNVVEAGAAYEYIDRTDSSLLDAGDDNTPLVKAALMALEDAQATAKANARPAIPKPRSVSAEDAGVIDKAIAAYDIDSVIEAEGYRRIGRAWLSPNSTTGSAGVHILTGPDGKKRLYSHHGESDPLSSLNHNGHALDVFDVLVALKYSGDFSRAVRALADDLDPDGQKRRRQEYAQEKARHETIEQFGAAVTPEAQKIADHIHQQLLERMGINPADDPDAAESLLPNGENITRMINGAFWSGTKSKIFLLNHDESLVQFKEPDAYKFLCRTFGAIIDKKAVTDLAKSLVFGCPSPVAEESARSKFISGCMAIALTAILDHLKYANQRESVEWRVDMFAKFSRLELQEDKARIVLTHKPFPLPRRRSDYAAIIADYLEHFPRLDAFIDLLVAARFAGDRKKAYLWLFATTDWGKGILLGALSQLGLVVNLHVKEVEAMFEGKPVGRSPLDFKRAFVLAIDEFKTVKAELKQLQSIIELAPKNQLTSSVEVFTKLFLSAESVASLVGENGVEDQFANRMSIFREHGSIEDRPLFIKVGKDAYRNAMASYIAEKINQAVARLRPMGREEATRWADEAVTKFHRTHGLDTVYERFSESLPDLVGQLKAWIDKNPLNTVNFRGGIYLPKPNLIIDEFINNNLTQSEAGAMRRKKTEIIDLISFDGKGVNTCRIPGPTRAVRLA